jgi:hypothetical protein
MCRQNHCCAVDYFALGVIGYEFMLGRVRYFSILYYVLENVELIFAYRDHIMVNQEKKLEMQFSQSKYRLRNMKFLRVGQ